MPNRDAYAGLTLADAIRLMAERHHEQHTRHISTDEFQLLVRAAAVLERDHAHLLAFS